MFDDKLSLSLNWGSNQRRDITFWRNNSPNGVINWLGVQANLLIS